MIKTLHKRNFLVLLLCLGIATIVAANSPRQTVTVEWIFGDEPKAIEAIPKTFWLPDDSCLLLDSRRPEGDRTLERLDPQTGNLQPALNLPAALASLKNLMGEGNAPTTLPWPTSFDASANHALYVFKDRIFVLEIPLARFQRVTPPDQAVQAPSLSPDGRFVAYVRDNDLYVYNLQKQTQQRLTTDGSATVLNGVFSWVYWEEIFGHRAAAYWWSDDSKNIAFLSSDDSPVSTTTFTDFQPDQARVFTQRYPQAGQPTPLVRMGVVNVDSGAVVWAALPAGYEYITRVTWLPGSSQIAVQTMNRAQTQVNLHLLDRVTGKVKSILKETDDAWVHIYDPYFLKDGKYFLWISDRSGYAHIYRYSLDGRLVNPVTTGEWSIRPFGAYAIYGNSPIAAVDEKKGWVYFTAAKKSSIEQQIYRVHLDGTGLEQISREDGFHRANFCRDGRFYFDRYSNHSLPPALTLHHNDGKCLRVLTAPRTDLLAPFEFQYPTFLKIPAADGFPLPAQLSKPARFDPQRKYPVILYVYGGPSAPSVVDSWNTNGWSQPVYFDQVLLDKGYIMMSVENRSSASIGKKFEKSIKGQMYGDVELGDLLAAVRWLKAQPFVDPQRIGIWGWSGGGTYTLLALTSCAEFKAGIAVAPVTDWHYYDAKWTEMPMKRPIDNPDGYRNTSLVRRAANLHGRLLLVHGTYDDNVHPQNSQAFMNELINAGILFDLMVYPMRKHNIDDPPARIHLYKTMVEFWLRNL